jgi:mono/diheme cytochrome c family protein
MIRFLPLAASAFVILAIAGLGSSATQAKAEQVPVVDSEAVQLGRRLYVKHCSHCHGFNMVNPGTVSFDLRKFPKDDPDRFFHSVKEGKNTMPAWKDSLSDDAIRLLWTYVRVGGKH